jgi:hypothetical protein
MKMAKPPDDEEKRAVLREWDGWVKEHPGSDPMLFYTHLQRARPDLLEFKSRGADKWQRVHGWLLQSGRVKK